MDPSSWHDQDLTRFLARLGWLTSADGSRIASVDPVNPALATPSSTSQRSSAPQDEVPAVLAPGLAVAVVARRLGVAPATLRTWARRYGLGPSRHSTGAHRRYSPQDLARLDLMRRMVSSGVAPGDAARAALAASAEMLVSAPDFGLVPSVRAGPDGHHDRTGPRSGHDAGGHRSAAGADPALTLVLARHASALDGPACIEVITGCVEQRGVVWTWEHLLTPVLAATAPRTGSADGAADLLAESIIASMFSVLVQAEPAVNARPVLLACAEDEVDSLPLFVTSAALAEQQVYSRVLGARVPIAALAAAIRRIGPAAVLLWSSAPDLGAAQRLEQLTGLRPAPLLLVFGPGWEEQAPPGVSHARGLADAVTRICGAAH